MCLAGADSIPPLPASPTQRRRVPWRVGERDAVKRCLMAFGVGRWKEVRSA